MKKNSKTKSIDQTPFEIQFSLVAIVLKLKLRRMIAGLVAVLARFMV